MRTDIPMHSPIPDNVLALIGGGGGEGGENSVPSGATASASATAVTDLIPPAAPAVASSSRGPLTQLDVDTGNTTSNNGNTDNINNNADGSASPQRDRHTHDSRVKQLLELAKNTNRYRAIAQRGRVQFAATFGFAVFLVCSTLLYIADCILVGFGITGDFISYQYYVFIASTVLSVFAHVSTAVCIDEPSMGIAKKIFILLDAPALGEYVCIILGWVFVTMRPGVSALRCLRVFRQFWHFDNCYRSLNPTTKSRFGVLSVALFCRQVVQYANKLGDELFSSRSRGGLSILGIYFFVTYLFAILFWIEAKDVETLARGAMCDTLSHCYITMIRVSVFDTGGLDYFAAVQAARPYTQYTACMVLYIIIASVILFNGLIGAFGYGLVLSVRGKEREVHFLNNAVKKPNEVSFAVDGNNNSAGNGGNIHDRRNSGEGNGNGNGNDDGQLASPLPYRSQKIIDNVTRIAVKESIGRNYRSASRDITDMNGIPLYPARPASSSSGSAMSTARNTARVEPSEEESKDADKCDVPVGSGMVGGGNADEFEAVIAVLNDIRGEVMGVSTHVKQLMTEIDSLKQKL
jgi:hypothetical protein